MTKHTKYLTIFFLTQFAFADNWTEDFNTETSSSYGTSFTINSRIWTCQDAGNFTYANTNMGSYAFTINDDKSGAHITTPALNTCGTVNFKYAYLNGTSSNVFVLQYSTDGTNYTNLDTHTLGASANLSYITYSYAVNNTAGTIYIRILSDNQDAHLFIEDFSVTNYDFTPPTWSSNYPQVQNIAGTALDVAVNLDEPGTAYFVVLADGAAAPFSAQVKAGTDAGDIAVATTSKGTITVSAAATEYTGSASELTSSTNYDIYVVAEDDETTPNLQVSTVKIDTATIFVNTPPVVSNVTFAQRTDGSGIVDVYYDVSDVDNDTLLITMPASDDGGATWGFTTAQTSGDIGNGITPGSNKQIVWQAGNEHPDAYYGNVVIKITACDNCMMDIDGNTYEGITIGTQVWMAENLKVTKYRNGDAIPTGYSNSDWGNLATGAYAVYNDDINNTDTYGLYYNWYAVDDSRNIAPTGWHVPTDDEWKQLEMYLGMSQSEADDTSWRGTNEGSKLAGNAGLWYSGNLENNAEFGTSGFTALPGGSRDDDGNYSYMGSLGYFWSSTEINSGSAWDRLLDYNNSGVFRYSYDKRYGFVVRLVRD